MFMKTFQSILLWVVTAAVAVLFILHFTARTGNTKSTSLISGRTDSVKSKQHLSVAYVDLDTIQKYYEYFKLKNSEIERDKQRIDNEIQGQLNKLEKDRVEFIKRGQSITQAEAEQFQQEYQTRYQQIGQRQQTLQGEHIERQAKAIDDIEKRISDYLKEYNKDGKYQFIFSTQDGNPTLYYKDTTFNITRDVLKGLNEAYSNSKKQ